MEYDELNLEIEKPTVDEALAKIEIKLELCKKMGTKVLKVIHGYGSSGKGGAIKNALKTWLVTGKRKKLFKDFVKGEEWNSSAKAEEIKKLCPSVLGDMELFFINPGLTIIVV